jgi:hypothetical protein
MFRTKDGEHKFSFTRFMSNASPVLAGAPQDIELSSREQDLVFTHQLGEPDPLILSPQVFLHAGITSASKTSASIHKALLKNGVLEKDSSVVNTGAITRNFPNQLSIITSHAQKKLINLLFFWEEEGQRWKGLIGELDELRIVIDAEKETGGNVGTYEKRLAEVEGMMRLLPSLRSKQAKEDEALPEYVQK